MSGYSSIKAIALVVLTLPLLTCRSAEKQRADLRPFDSIFTYIDEIKLQGINPKDAAGFAIDSTGAIYAIDEAYKHVKKFDEAGRLVKTIGAPGKGPGLFVLPWGLACDGKDNLYVLDTAQSRVNIFDSAGNFQKSFIFSSAGFSGTSMTVSRSGEIYLGGWKSPLNDSSTLIHKFDQEGNHLASFFPLDEQVYRLNLTIAAGVGFAIDSADSLYAIQQVNPMFSKFSQTGQYVGQFGRKPPFYQEPFKFPKLKYPRDEAKAQSLLAEWTQLADIFIIDRLVLLAFRTHTPKEYALEVYDENGKVLEGGVGSDMAPVMKDHRNRLYFFQSASESEQADHVSLLRCNINLHPTL